MYCLADGLMLDEDLGGVLGKLRLRVSIPLLDKHKETRGTGSLTPANKDFLLILYIAFSLARAARDLHNFSVCCSKY